MTFCVTFVSQNYRSQFKVAGENVLLSVESEKLKPRKPDLATWSKGRPELETGKKVHWFWLLLLCNVMLATFADSDNAYQSEICVTANDFG